MKALHQAIACQSQDEEGKCAGELGALNPCLIETKWSDSSES